MATFLRRPPGFLTLAPLCVLLAVAPARSQNPFPAPNPYSPNPGAPPGQRSVSTQPSKSEKEKKERKREEVSILDALGVPNRDGHITWPLGLRILPDTDEANVLEKQIEALLKLAGNQVMEGRVNPRFLKRTTRDVTRLRKMVNACKWDLGPNTANEALRFLERVDEAVDLLSSQNELAHTGPPAPPPSPTPPPPMPRAP